MKCNLDSFETNNKKSFSNHLRMHKGFSGKGNKYPNKSTKGVSRNKGNKHGLWKGNNVGLIALHAWIYRNKIKSNICENCKKNKKLDAANISGKYKRDINDFKWLCRSCHVKMDHLLHPHNKKGDFIKRV